MAVIVFAASETTSSALTAILGELLQHDTILRNTTKEVRLAFRTESDISIASTRELDKLQQLDAVARCHRRTQSGLERRCHNLWQMGA